MFNYSLILGFRWYFRRTDYKINLDPNNIFAVSRFFCWVIQLLLFPFILDFMSDMIFW